MQTSTEIPTATAAELQPREGEDQPTAVLRVVSALGGIAQTLRPNGRPGTVMVTDPALVKQVLVRGSMDEDLGLIRNFALRTAAPHGLISLTGPEHRKVRVAAAPCFRGTGLAPLEDALDRRLERGLDEWPTGTVATSSKLVLDLLTKVFMEWILGPLDPAREAELCAAGQSWFRSGTAWWKTSSSDCSAAQSSASRAGSSGPRIHSMKTFVRRS
ncbi:MAG: hypothetical protein EBU70_14860, partial [Actinobacteria bacterium]|nr:hypothetical protein [Actinomycetota bacterium]